MLVNIYPVSDTSNGTPKSLVHFQRVNSLLSGNGLLTCGIRPTPRLLSFNILKNARGNFPASNLHTFSRWMERGECLEPGKGSSAWVAECGEWWLQAGDRWSLRGSPERLERDASCAHLFPFAKHPQETWEVYGKARVCSAEMLTSPHS